jgi:hypothetical protein
MKTKSTISLIIFLLLGIGMISAYAASNTPPTGWMDSATYKNNQILANGWAADKEDGAPVEKVMVYIDDKFVGNARIGLDRKGVATVMKNQKWERSGWDFLKTVKLSKGVHEVYAIAFNKKGTKVKLFNAIKLNIK